MLPLIVKTVVITICLYWVVGCIVAMIDEEKCIYVATGLVYPLLIVLLYPVRAFNAYRSRETYYKKNGVSFVAYLFGTRLK